MRFTRIRYTKKDWNCPDYGDTMFFKDTEESAGDLKRLVITQVLNDNHLISDRNMQMHEM